MRQWARGAAVVASLVVCGGPVARAQEVVLTGTLKTIRDRGTILIGYRENAAPFAFTNKAGQPVGFSVDICHGIAGEVARRLSLDLLEPDAPAWEKGVRIAYLPVAAEARLPMVTAGAIDLECGSTTANDERAKTVAFSPTIFLAGVKLMAPLAPAGGKAVSSTRDLAGRKLAVAAGTTTDPVVKALASKVSPPIAIVEQPSVDAAYALLASGAVDAMASDDILLSGLVATKPDGRRFAGTGDYLSYEPDAITFRKDDPGFAEAVRGGFEGMATSDYLTTNYRKWFESPLPGGENLRLPMSAQLTEFYRVLGQSD